MIIYFNPECSKCREALNIIEGENCKVDIRNYLELPPTKKELSELLTLLGCRAEELVRKDEALFKEKYAHRNLSESDYFQMLISDPILLQRPIIVDGEQAIVGRPPVLVLELIKTKR